MAALYGFAVLPAIGALAISASQVFAGVIITLPLWKLLAWTSTSRQKTGAGNGD